VGHGIRGWETTTDPLEEYVNLVAAIEEPRAIDPIADPRGELASLFEHLAEQWRRDTALFSSLTDIVLHPSYQRIIGLGQKVVPLILAELDSEPDHWFWALVAITGKDVAAGSDSVNEASRLWTAWGRRHAFLIP